MVVLAPRLGRSLLVYVNGAAVLVLVMVWTGSLLAHLPPGQAIVSVVWAVIGTAVLVAGAVRKVPDYGTAGLAVFALTVGTLLTVDLAEGRHTLARRPVPRDRPRVPPTRLPAPLPHRPRALNIWCPATSVRTSRHPPAT
jgi:hypothetical protein